MAQENSSHYSQQSPRAFNGRDKVYGNQGRYGGEYNGNGAYSASGGQDDADDFSVIQLLASLFRYKWWVIGTIIFCTATAYYYVSTITPLYQSSGTLLIVSEQTSFGGNSGLSGVLAQSYGVGGSNWTNFYNEIQTLKSRQLSDAIAQAVIQRERMENGQIFPILMNNYPNDTTRISEARLSGRIGSILDVSHLNMNTEILSISFQSPSPYEAMEMVNLTMETYVQVSATQRRVAARSALKFLEGELATAQRRLAASENRLEQYMSRTSLVQIDGQTSALISRIAEMETQLQQIQVQRVAINSSIDSYEGQLELIRPGLAEQFSENVSGQIERAQFRLAELQIERSLLMQRNTGQSQNLAAEPQFMQLENEIESIRREIRTLATNLLDADDTDAYIGFLGREDGGIAARISELRRNIIDMRIQETQLNAQEDAIRNRLVSENSFFDTLPENMIELARLRREAEINEELFKTISQQHQETQLLEQTQYGSGRPMDYAILPGGPFSPNAARYIFMGLLFGGLLSFGGVFVMEQFNNKIDGAEKIKANGYKLLSVIPDMEEYISDKFEGMERTELKGKMVSTGWSSLLDSLSPLSESYRRLHNNIIFSNPDKKYTAILVTSSKPGEGKTTVSVNLASTLAEYGKNVILIDCDLHRPNIHHFTGEKIQPGLTDMVNGDSIAFIRSVQTSVQKNLEIITAGSRVPNPAAIFNSQKLITLMLDLKERYDYVIIDTPPYGVITDSGPLMRYVADAVIMVTRFGTTNISDLNHVVESLEMIHAPLIGTVLTNYKHKKSTDYYYSSSKYKYDSYKEYKQYKSHS